MRLRKRARSTHDEPTEQSEMDWELYSAKRALSVAQGSLYEARDREKDVSRIAESLEDVRDRADEFGRSIARAYALRGT